MHTDLREFLINLTTTVATTLTLVMSVAFISLPMSLSHHPGEAPSGAASRVSHMT